MYLFSVNRMKIDGKISKVYFGPNDVILVLLMQLLRPESSCSKSHVHNLTNNSFCFCLKAISVIYIYLINKQLSAWAPNKKNSHGFCFSRNLHAGIQ